MNKFILILSALVLSTAAHADQNEILKNLSAHPVHFEFASDINVGNSSNDPRLYLFAPKEDINAQLYCTRATTWFLQPYLYFQVFNRLGMAIGYGYRYMNSTADCKNLLNDLFDHPEAYEYTFGPMNYQQYREVTMTKKDEGAQK